MLNIAICDDEEIFIDKEEHLISDFLEERFSQIEYSMKKYVSGTEMLEEMDSQHIDLVFLDIELGKEDGFEIARRLVKLDRNTKIIFVTSHENLVFNSFEFRPVGFIRKRIVEKEIPMVMNQVMTVFIEENVLIEIGENKKSYTLMASAVQYIDTYGHNITVKVDDKKLTVRDKLARFEEQLPKDRFIKINRGSVVNLRYIASFQGDEITLKDGERFKVSRSKMKNARMKYDANMGLSNV